MRRFLAALHLPLLLSLAVLSAIGLLLYYISGVVIFGGRIASAYERPLEPVCNTWYRQEVLKDHRSPEAISASGIHVPGCEEALQFPKHTEMLTTEEGLKVRLVIPELPEAPAIWLHVHGITDSYLNGMRFTEVARRQGFQLMMLELQNHGGSDRHEQGSSWGCREKYDLIAAMDRIRKEWPEKPVLLSGTSMGTLTITQAVLTRPVAFAAVRGIIFESPISSLDNISDRICLGRGSICAYVFKTFIPFFTPLRTNTDFQSCFKEPNPPIEIPTELWLSRDEFRTLEHQALAAWMPAHRHVNVETFDHGTHSAYYGYEPEAVEAALQRFWNQVKGVPVPPAESEHEPALVPASGGVP